MNLLLIGVLGVAWALGAGQVRNFERIAAQEIASQLQGEHKQVQVRASTGLEAAWGDIGRVTITASNFRTEGLPFYTEPERSTRGVLRNLIIELSDFELTGLEVRRLRAEIPDNRFDLGLAMNQRQIRLSRSGVGEAEVEVTQEALERYLVRKFREIKRATIRIEKDKVFVDGLADLVLFESEFSLIARLEPLEGTKLALVDARIILGGELADDATRAAMMRTLNPVLDLDKDLLLHGAVTVDRLVLRDGVLRASGKAKIPQRPKE
jgi:hypothetical protein